MCLIVGVIGLYFFLYWQKFRLGILAIWQQLDEDIFYEIGKIRDKICDKICDMGERAFPWLGRIPEWLTTTIGLVMLAAFFVMFFTEYAGYAMCVFWLILAVIFLWDTSD